MDESVALELMIHAERHHLNVRDRIKCVRGCAARRR
jgi:hypothetical protein